MDKDLTNVKQKSFRYWFEDGLSDIVIGSFLGIIGAVTSIQGRLEPGSFFSGLFGLVFVVVVAFGIPLTRKLLRAMKERYIYPRTGFLAYKGPTSMQRTLSGTLGICIAIIVVILISVSTQFSITWVPLILGFMLAGFLFLIGLRTSMFRYQIMAFMMILIGILSSYLNNPEWLSTGMMLSSLGLMLIFSGLFAFVYYLRKTRPPQEAADGN